MPERDELSELSQTLVKWGDLDRRQKLLVARLAPGAERDKARELLQQIKSELKDMLARRNRILVNARMSALTQKFKELKK